MDLIISEKPCQALLIEYHGINTAGAAIRFIFTFEKIIAMPVPKLIHIQNGERNFIRFGGKPRLLIEVFQHKAYDGISDSMQEVYDDFERLEVPSVIHHEELDGYFFLFIITQFPEGIKPGFEDRMRRNLEFSANWYLHQCFRKNL